MDVPGPCPHSFNIIDGDIVMAGPRYGAVARAASFSYAGESSSIIDCRACPAGSSSFCVPSCPAGFLPLSRAFLLPDVMRLA